jgi:hypothetical protein
MSSSSASGIGSNQDDGNGNGVCQSDVDAFESAMQQESQSFQEESEDFEEDLCRVEQIGVSADNYNIFGCGFNVGQYRDTVTDEKGLYGSIECGIGQDIGADYTMGCAPNVEAQQGVSLSGEARDINIATNIDGMDTGKNMIVTANSGTSDGPLSGHIAVGYGNYISYDDLEKATEAIKDAPGDVKEGLQDTLDYALQEGYRTIISRIR